ncbi:hypothetical protein LJC22_06815 [Desulfosarcina sp. OttesenSCG-928-G10]|nr:hypothetical protein [Desulfosarcina sp. OttesenSCG-928-G10]MDL2320750.1 hypothetical protein [Desulfosarcina sp. OttesenSCG-928-B08]
MKNVRTEEEIIRVKRWASDSMKMGMGLETHYPEMTYEQGVLDAIMWLFGDSNLSPDMED